MLRIVKRHTIRYIAWERRYRLCFVVGLLLVLLCEIIYKTQHTKSMNSITTILGYFALFFYFSFSISVCLLFLTHIFLYRLFFYFFALFSPSLALSLLLFSSIIWTFFFAPFIRSFSSTLINIYPSLSQLLLFYSSVCFICLNFWRCCFVILFHKSNFKNINIQWRQPYM